MAGNESVSVGEGSTAGSFRGKGRQNMKGNRTDLGWRHGTDVLGDAKKVKCSFCAKVISGGIYRFKHHLGGTSEDCEPCAQVSDQVRLTMLKLIATGKEASMKKRKLIECSDEGGSSTTEVETCSSPCPSVSKHTGKGKFATSTIQSTINQIVKKPLKEEADHLVAMFFYTSAIPFNCIKNPAFAKMCDAIGRYGIGYKPPTYHDIRDKLLKRAVLQTDQIVEDFKEEWKRTGCSIMSDGWTDRKKRSICNFMVNSPKGTVFLYSLDTSDISKTTEKVCKMLDDVVEFVGEENVIQVVTDNAANYKAGGELLMLKRKHLYWTPCAAHCIDLIFEDFEKELILHHVTIKKARKFTTYIYSRTMLIIVVRKFTNGRDLIRPAMTRFATAYLTLGCLNDLKSSLLNMFNSNDWKCSRYHSTVEEKKIEKDALDTRFWKNIIMCLKTAAPLMEVLRLVDSDAKPSMGFIYEAMDSCKNKIRKNFSDVQKYYEPVWKIINERWTRQLHRPLHAAAYYLNPQYHFSNDFKGDNIDVKNGLYDCLTKLVSGVAEREKVNIQLADFHFRQGPFFGTEYARNAMKNMHPAQWWEMYGDYTPELKKFAIRVLSLTGSSSGCERNWSAFEMVHTKKRNRLHQQKMNDLVYVMANKRLTRKETRKREQLEFIDIESDDEFLTTFDGSVNNDDENLPQPIHVEGSSGSAAVGSTSSDPFLVSSNNLVFGSNIEDPLSEDEYDNMEDEGSDGNGDYIVEGF
ncbi:unnamed protein product [Rhodiola kirilowii]